MRGNKALWILLLCVWVSSGIHALGSPRESEQSKKFQVDLFGGMAFTNPTDLNLRPEYDDRYLVDQREYYSTYFPSATQGLPSAEFRKAKTSYPMGLRLRYRFSPLLSLSLGVKYFSREQSSEVLNRFSAAGGRPYVLEYRFYPYVVAFSGTSPLLGVHLTLKSSEDYELELFLSGGPLFARCQYEMEISRFYSRNNTVYRANQTSYAIQGKSTGLVLDAGARVQVRVMRNIALFCEGGYALQKARNLHGPGEFELYIYRDVDTQYLSDQLDWEGYWGVKQLEAFAPLPSNEWEKDDPRVNDFELDLSGLFLQLGVSVSFSLD